MSTDARPRVLCVDDDPQLLKSLRWLLARDHDVVLAEGGEEGLQALAAGAFDVIISDQRMPHMTGTEFLAQARALSPRSTRLLLTGYADFPAVQASVNDAEVFRFISKPWDSASLLAIVAEAVQVARARPADGDLPGVDLEIDPLSESVLVFDRDPAVATQVTNALQDTRHVQWSNGIGEVVHMLSSRQVAVLVTDIGDGDLQQMDLIRALRNHQPQVVVVVYSQLRDSATLGQLINEGKIHRYLTKPAVPDYLLRTLQSALLRHREIMSHPETAMKQALQALGAHTFENAFADVARRPASDRPPAAGGAGTGRHWLRRLFD